MLKNRARINEIYRIDDRRYVNFIGGFIFCRGVYIANGPRTDDQTFLASQTFNRLDIGPLFFIHTRGLYKNIERIRYTSFCDSVFPFLILKSLDAKVPPMEISIIYLLTCNFNSRKILGKLERRIYTDSLYHHFT